jgi:hypothetical protein
MSRDGITARTTPPRLRRVLELVYGVEGVVSARVWQWAGRVAIGVRGGSTTSPMDLIRRIEAAVAGLREPDEHWDFGILEEGPPQPGAAPETSGLDLEGELSSPRKWLRSPS